MTQIKSRTADKQSPEYQAALREIAGEVAIELDSLVDKMSDFLEMRLTAEIDELKEDIDDALMLRAVNDALMKENMAFRDQITALSIQNLDVSMKLARFVALTNGTKE